MVINLLISTQGLVCHFFYIIWDLMGSIRNKWAFCGKDRTEIPVVRHQSLSYEVFVFHALFLVCYRALLPKQIRFLLLLSFFATEGH